MHVLPGRRANGDIMRNTVTGLVAVSLAALLASQSATAEPIIGLTTGNSLVSFDSAAPGTLGTAVAVTGLAAGTILIGIDFRPLDRQLVGVGNLGGIGTVYAINPYTGAATPINSGFALTGDGFGVDFNPVPNALRIVSNADQNLRITAGGTGVVNTDSALNPGDPNIVGAAYANNIPGGIGGQTTLYVIDSDTDSLLTQGTPNFPPGTSPNTGTLSVIGGLGFDTTDLVGFDISRDTGTAYASLTGPTGGGSQLFTIDLGTGGATLIGGFDGLLLADITVSQVPAPLPLAMLAFGLVGMAVLRRR